MPSSPSNRCLGELLANLPVTSPPRDAAVHYRELQHDSRKVGPDDVFVALPGDHVDGHSYVPAVAAAGARAAIVDSSRVQELRSQLESQGLARVEVIGVQSTKAALSVLAGNHFRWPQRQLQICGITGTNGKSTVAHLISQVFAALGIPHLRLATTGNWVVDHLQTASHTTPFPIELLGLMAQARERSATHVVMEVASHAIAQQRIAGLLFECVAMTSFSQDHLDFHQTMEAYLEAKCRLARDYLQPDGKAIAHGKDSAGQAFLQAARASQRSAWSIGEAHENPEITLLSSVLEVDGIIATVRLHGHEYHLRSPLVGAYNLENLLVALGCTHALGLPMPHVLEALAHAKGAPGRLERIESTRTNAPAVFVDYAHTPDAIERALQAVQPYCRGKLSIVFGCGGDRDRSKRPLMGKAAIANADRVWITSDNPRTEDPDAIIADILAGNASVKIHVERDRALAIAQAIAEAGPQDIVIVAGKGHEDYQILGTTKVPFSDHSVVRAALGS